MHPLHKFVPYHAVSPFDCYFLDPSSTDQMPSSVKRTFSRIVVTLYEKTKALLSKKCQRVTTPILRAQGLYREEIEPP